jgi:protein gp37
MGEATKIQWAATVMPDGSLKAGYTWSPWRGCTKVSDGCKLCYAEALSRRNPKTMGVWGPQGTRVVNADWNKPIRWDREAEKAGVRMRVFPSLCDWLEGREELVDVRERFAALIQATPHLDWLLLTKRPESIHLASEAFGWNVASHGLPPNVWYGVSVEDQARAVERLPRLAEVRAGVRWVSYEPALGPVDFGPWLEPVFVSGPDPDDRGITVPGLDWIVVGGESSQGGKAARPFDVAWARSVVGQCCDASTAVFVKQLGSRPFDSAARIDIDGPGSHAVALDLADSHGGDPDEWPEDLRVRQQPRIERTVA